MRAEPAAAGRLARRNRPPGETKTPHRRRSGQGHLARLWALPGAGRVLGLWRAQDDAGMQAILASLPLDDWMTEQTTPLSPHPSDPALAGS